MSARSQNLSFWGPDVQIKGAENKDKPLRVFDWHKAAALIAAALREGPVVAEAGLAGDWAYTGGQIFNEGGPNLESYMHLASTWATPTLVINDEEVDCWLSEDQAHGWDAKTKWPESALKILE